MSAREVAALVDSYKAGSTLASSHHFCVTLSSGNVIPVTTAGGFGLGVALDKPASGGETGVGMVGIFEISYGGTMTALDKITVDSAGEYVKSVNDDDWIHGICIESGSNGDIRSGLMGVPYQASPLKTVDGRGDKHILRTTYDFATDGGAVGTISLPETLPNNAVVTRGYFFVATQVTSGGSATVALSIASDDVAGLLAATAIGTMGTAGWHECIQDGTAANFSEACTAERAIQVVVATADLTAGNFTLFLEYVIID